MHAVWDEDVVKAEAGGTMTLVADIRSGCENYLYFTGEDTGGIWEIDIKSRYLKYGHSITPLVVNLGTIETDGKVEVTISFNSAMTFDPKTLQVLAYDLKDYADQIEALKKGTEGKFTVETNKIYGNFDMEQNKILCYAIPYSDGWHARVDGKKAAIHLVNDMFMGIEVPEGVHKVEMYYVTPGVHLGLCFSVVSVLFTAGYLVRQIVLKRLRV